MNNAGEREVEMDVDSMLDAELESRLMGEGGDGNPLDVEVESEDFGQWDGYAAQYDDDPDPYGGTYSED